MKLTPALYVRHLLAQLHPPLPKSPRESLQLLNILDASFRKQLDDLHPAPRASTEGADQKPPDGPSPASYNSVYAADTYLNSVLQHPALRHGHVKDAKTTTWTARALYNFDKALVEERVGITYIVDCARKYLKGLKNKEQVTIERKLGHRIASWFYSTTSANKQAFLQDGAAVNNALRVMYADGQDEIVWDWLRIMYERDFGSSKSDVSVDAPSKSWLKAEDHFISMMMRASISQGHIAEAAQQYVQACEYRCQSGGAVVELCQSSAPLTFAPLMSSWTRLAATILYRREKHSLPSHVFDGILKHGVSWSHGAAIPSAFLRVYHPEGPTASYLIQSLKHTPFTEQFMKWQQGLSEPYRKATVTCILDGAKLSLDQNSVSSASFLLDIAEQHYPEFLSEKPTTNIASRLEYAQEELGTPFSYAIA